MTTETQLYRYKPLFTKKVSQPECVIVIQHSNIKNGKILTKEEFERDYEPVTVGASDLLADNIELERLAKKWFDRYNLTVDVLCSSENVDEKIKKLAEDNKRLAEGNKRFEGDDIVVTLENMHTFHPFRGDDPNVTDQQVVDEMNKALEQVRSIKKDLERDDGWSVDALAIILCDIDGHDPYSKEGGNYTIPYDADYIGEDNIACDGYRYSHNEPWKYSYRKYGEKAMQLKKSFNSRRLPSTPKSTSGEIR